MNPLRFALHGLLVILAAVPAFAVTDTWDGGGVNDLITLGDNWVDNTAPAMIVRGNMVVKSALNIGNGGTVILGDGPAPAPSVDEFLNPKLGGPGGDLEWDATQLQSTGQLRVVPEPGIGALLASALALLGLRRSRPRTPSRVSNLNSQLQ